MATGRQFAELRGVCRWGRAPCTHRQHGDVVLKKENPLTEGVKPPRNRCLSAFLSFFFIELTFPPINRSMLKMDSCVTPAYVDMSDIIKTCL